MPEDRPRTLLLVEDEAIIALNERAMLERNGFRVQVVHSGEAAIDAVRAAAELDLVLMDIDLGPGMDGTEASRRILDIREVPIVFLTSHAEPEYVERVEQISGYGYVLKSSGEFVLVRSVEMALRLREAHTHMEREKERYRLITENASETILTVDTELNVTYVSPSIEQLTGFTPQEYRRMSPAEQLTAESARWVVETGHLQQQDPNCRTDAVELERLCKGGGTVWTETISRPIVTDDGQVTGHVATIRDISERKRLESDLQTANARLQATLDAMPDLFFELDAEHRFLTYRAPASKGLYVPPEEFLGRRIDDVLPNDIAARLSEALESARRGGGPTAIDYSLIEAGETRFFRASIAAQPDGVAPRYIVLVHEQLQTGGEQDEIELGPYLDALLGGLFRSLSTREVHVDLDAGGVTLPGGRAVSVGLLVNEIATNAIKHSFDDSEAHSFAVSLSRQDEGYLLSVSSSGSAIPEDIDIENPPSLGLQLVTGLVRQLGGTLDLQRRPHPAYTILFPAEDEHPRINVEVTAMVPQDYWTKSRLQANQQALPDVFDMSSGFLESWANDGFLYDLTPFVSDSPEADEFYPGLVGSARKRC